MFSFDPKTRYPVTVAAIKEMGLWLNEIVTHVGKPAPSSDNPLGLFEFQRRDALTVAICKAVRMISGLNAILCLVQAGYVVEGASLLRSVEDFEQEIRFLCEGSQREVLTAEYQQFVEDFFIRPPSTREELKDNTKKRFVSRSCIRATLRREAEATPGVDAQEYDDLGRILGFMQNSYVHGGYYESMKLYDPYSESFASEGHLPEKHVDSLMKNVAMHVFRCLGTMYWLACQFDLRELSELTYRYFRQYEASDEYRSI